MNSPVIGVDFGYKRTGIALSESGLIARPLTTLEADPPHMHKVLSGIADIVAEYEAKTVVVGQPYTESGQETSQSVRFAKLITSLEETLARRDLDAEILTINEFYSSAEAKERFPNDPLDAGAAAVILQYHLDQSANS